MEIIERYLDYCKTERLMRPKSLVEYKTAVLTLRQKIDPLKCKDYSDVNNAIKKISSERRWSPLTCYKHAKCIKNFFAWLHREKIIKSNPFPFHEFKRGRLKEPEFITEKQFIQILTDPFLTHQEKTLLHVLWDCAPRVSELCSIDQEEINFDENYIHIPREKTKGGYSDRYVPFTPETSELLKHQIMILKNYGVHKAVFVNMYWNRLDESRVSECISKIGLRKTPIRESMRLTPHMFRHSFGMRMIEKNVPEIIVQKWLGHSSLSMTSHYSHMAKDTSLALHKKYVHDLKIA